MLVNQYALWNYSVTFQTCGEASVSDSPSLWMNNNTSWFHQIISEKGLPRFAVKFTNLKNLQCSISKIQFPEEKNAHDRCILVILSIVSELRI